MGSSGINQANYNHNYNLAQLASPSNPINGVTTNTEANAVYRVPYLGYQPIGMQGTEYDATYHYNSLQTTVRKQFSYGLTMQGAFTWSKDLSDLQECGPTGCIGDGQTNSNLATNLAQQMGPAASSHPLRFVLSYNYQLPFGHAQGALGKLSNGWSVSGTTIVQNGTPLTFTNTNGGTAYYGAANPGSGEGGSSRAQLCPGMTYSSIQSSGGVESRLGGNSGGPGWIRSWRILRSARCAVFSGRIDAVRRFRHRHHARARPGEFRLLCAQDHADHGKAEHISSAPSSLTRSTTRSSRIR